MSGSAQPGSGATGLRKLEEFQGKQEKQLKTDPNSELFIQKLEHDLSGNP